MNEKTQELLVIIPAYNEMLALPKTIDDLRQAGIRADILVVNDGSNDQTSIVAKNEKCIVINLPFNLGIGGAVQTGLIFARENGYKFAIQFDADGQHIASEIDKILKPIIDDEYDVVIGSRFIEYGGFKSSFARRLGIKLFKHVISTAIHKRITDATSGFRAYNAKAIDFLSKNYPCDYPEVEAVVILAKSGFRICEVATLMRERVAGKSSITPLHSIYYMVKVLLAILMTILREQWRHR